MSYHKPIYIDQTKGFSLLTCMNTFLGSGLGNFSFSMPSTAKTRGSRVVELPSSRLLSTAMTKVSPAFSRPGSSQPGQDFRHTTLVMQMGQFIDHDITHSPIFQFSDEFDDINFDETCCNGTEYPCKF